MLKLRNLTEDDVHQIVQWNQNKDAAFLYQWAGQSYSYPLSAEQIKADFEVEEKEKLTNNRTFAIERSTDHRFIGTVELRQIDISKKTASVCRFLIGEPYQGKGYGTQALKLLADFAKQSYNIELLVLKVFDFNTRGIRCYEQVGFEKVDFEQNVYNDGKRSWGRYYMAYRF